MKGETKMTQGRLEALKKLDADISYAENIVTELKCAEGLCICGYDNSEVRTKYLIDTLEEDADLRTLITKYYEDKLAKLRKEFEEA
jgi:hypothetical protein